MTRTNRKWSQAATLAVDNVDGSLLTAIRPPTSFRGGVKVVGEAAAPEPLVVESTPCSFVWIAAPLDDDGQQTNATAVFVGDSETQNMPLLPGNYRGVVIRIDDASKLYVRSAAAGEAVVYRITGVMDQEAAP